jgi:hypothetical protein
MSRRWLNGMKKRVKEALTDGYSKRWIVRNLPDKKGEAR